MDEISIEEARRTLGDITDRARLAGQATIITRHGKAAAVVAPALTDADRHILAEAGELAGDDLADASYDDALSHAQHLIGELLAIIGRRDAAQADEVRVALAPSAGISPGMQKWLQREAHVCGMSADVVIAAALAEYRARRTPESQLHFRDGTPNYHHRNVEFIEDGDA